MTVAVAPKGPQGPKGPKGPKGPQGPKQLPWNRRNQPGLLGPATPTASSDGDFTANRGIHYMLIYISIDIYIYT